MTSKVHQERWENAFESIMVEVERLIEHPELFKDEHLHATLYEEVENVCRFFKQVRRHCQESEEESLVNQINSYLQAEHHWSFDEDRLPWHQFLHHCGPGFPATRNNPLPAVSEFGLRQYIPPGGQFLLRSWENDIQRYRDKINPVSSPLRIYLPLRLTKTRGE